MKTASRHSFGKPHFVWLDYCCTILITIGVLLAIEQVFPFQSAPFMLILTPLLITSAFFLFEMKKRVGLIAAGVIAGFLLLLLLIGGGNMITYIGGFISWWIELFPRSSTYYRPGNITLALFLIHLASTTVVFLFVRFTRGALTVLIAASFLFAGILLYDYHSNLLALILIMTGALPLLAKSAYLYFERHRSGMITPEKNTALSAVSVCTAIVLLAALLLPRDTTRWQDPDLTNKLQSLVTDGLFNNPQKDSINMSGMGLQPDLTQLGGDISLDNTTPIMYVKGTNACSLKGLVYDHYNQSSWNATYESIIAFDNDSPQAEQVNAFGIRPIYNPDLITTMDLEISVLNKGNNIYSTGIVQKVSWLDDKLLDRGIFFYPRSEMLYRGEVTTPYAYRLVADVYQRNSPYFNSLIAEKEVASAKDTLFDTLTERYLQLPYDTLPSAITDINESLFDLSDSPYQKMVKLERYLRDQAQFTYTLTPGDVPEGTDFVTYFLNDRKGYCVYFASAMAVIARSVGVPSRFIAGYKVNGTGQDDTVVQAKNAHAWVECYIKGVGWIPFDPTPGANLEVAPKVTGSTDSQPTQTSAPEPQPTTTDSGVSTTSEALAATTASQTDSEHRGGKSSSIPYGTIVLVLLLVLLLLFAALILLQCYRSLTIFRLGNMRAKYKENGPIADEYYRDLLTQLRLLHYLPENKETIAGFARRVDAGLDLGRKGEFSMRSAGDILMRWRYGQIEPSDDDLKLLEQFHLQIERLLKERMNGLLYFIRRVVIIRYR